METLVYPAVTPVSMTKIRLRHPQERKENAKLCSENAVQQAVRNTLRCAGWQPITCEHNQQPPC